MTAAREERLYFADILDAIDRIREYTSEVRWTEIAGTRDRVIHGYFEVDLDIVWLIVEKDLPVLRGQIAPLLSPSAGGA